VIDRNSVLISMTRRKYVPAGDSHSSEQQIHVLQSCGTAVSRGYLFSAALGELLFNSALDSFSGHRFQPPGAGEDPDDAVISLVAGIFVDRFIHAR